MEKLPRRKTEIIATYGLTDLIDPDIYPMFVNQDRFDPQKSLASLILDLGDSIGALGKLQGKKRRGLAHESKR